jgi:hypothetical protein
MGSGGVVEWLMAPVLKTGDPKGSVGSNPTPSVFQKPSAGNESVPQLQPLTGNHQTPS